MVGNSKMVYQFKISLLEIKPTIWRRIQVPDNYTFSDLHMAIQRAMGWYDCHLYEFSTALEKIPENHLVRDTFSPNNALKNSKVYYEYDFGDSWEHEILLEKILPADQGTRYPVCLAGKRACPPEDCGGTPGYYNILRVMKNHKDNEYRSTMEWLGDNFYPEKFNPKDVSFG